MLMAQLLYGHLLPAASAGDAWALTTLGRLLDSMKQTMLFAARQASGEPERCSKAIQNLTARLKTSAQNQEHNQVLHELLESAIQGLSTLIVVPAADPVTEVVVPTCKTTQPAKYAQLDIEVEEI